MDVRRMHGRLAVVTGAGSGIGRETALLCARRGANLAICDINEAGLAETASVAARLGREVLSRTLDVSDRSQMKAFAGAVHERVAAVDLLVNNAGVGLGADFVDTPFADWDRIVAINLMGVVHGCHVFVPPMAARGQGGHVVNLSSAAGYFPNPSLGAYSATKFAVLGLSEALRIELRRHHIGVTAVCPGLINTPITRTTPLLGRAEAHRERVVRLYERRNYGPDRVAERILHGVQRNRAVMPVTVEAWTMWWLARFAPPLARLMAQAVYATTR